MTKSHIIAPPYSYSDFFVDDIIKDDGYDIGLKIRKYLSPRSKCDDEYIAYAEIDNGWHFNRNPFIFSERRAERGGAPYEGSEKIGNDLYIVTNSDGIPEDTALEISAEYYKKERDER